MRIKNVITIVTDSLSETHTSMGGYRRDTTPFLKHFFSTRGSVYKNARSNASWTLPSFASFLRSRLPTQIHTKELLGSEGTFPRLLKNEGVHVCAFLKEPTFTITESIFNAFGDSEKHAYPYKENEKMFRDASEWTRARSENQFFLFIHDTTPHTPYTPPEKYKTLFGAIRTESDDGLLVDKNYLQMLTGKMDTDTKERERVEILYDQQVRYFDDLVKNFVESIPKDLLKETAIIITSDHGDQFGMHHNIFNHGYSLYDEVIRVPLCIFIPEMNRAVINENVSLLDLAPTILSLFSINIPREYTGMSLMSKKKYLNERTICAEGGRVIPFDVRGRIKHIHNRINLEQTLFNPPHEITFIKGSSKLYCSRFRGEESYALAHDPDETLDLSARINPKQVHDEHENWSLLKSQVEDSTFPLRYLARTKEQLGATAVLQHHTIARREYGLLVNTPTLSHNFRTQLVLMIERFPYFPLSYLEILENLECCGRKNEYISFLLLTKTNWAPIYSSPQLLKEVVTELSYQETFSMNKIVERIKYVVKKNPLDLYRIFRAQKILLDKLYSTPLPLDGTHLSVVEQNIDIRKMRREIEIGEHFWYAHRKKQRIVQAHRHTQEIVLRNVPKENGYLSPIDGPHESIRTALALYFPRILEFVENFAHREKLGLGQVTLVRILPKQMTYRHTPNEKLLEKRERYHFIIQSPSGNLMFLGNEIKRVSAGDLIQCGNQAMLKSYNDSSYPRIDLSFNAYKI